MIVNFREIPLRNSKASAIRLYRSGILLTGIENFSIPRVNCHIDLRSKDEILNYPIPDILKKKVDFTYHYGMIDPLEVFKNIKIPTENDYLLYYQRLLDFNINIILDIFNLLSSNSFKSFWINCHHGKDRTGILIMLILKLTNYPIKFIVKDYIESGNSLLKHIDLFQSHWKKRNITKEEYMPRLQPSAFIAKNFLRYIDENFGGVTGLLLQHDFKESTLNNIISKFK